MDLFVAIVVVALLALAVVGHVALWVVPTNRLNALPIDHRVLKVYNRTSFFVMLLILLACATHVWWFFFGDLGEVRSTHDLRAKGTSGLIWDVVFTLYLYLCWTAGTLVTLIWCWRLLRADRFPRLLGNHTQIVDVTAAAGEDLAGSPRARLAARVPGNQALFLRVNTKEIRVPGLPPKLDGFSIVHLTDLHMAEHLRYPFHEVVVRLANELDGDLVAITGDIVDRRQCIDWIPPTLGKLTSRHGVYFVVGNHDQRTGDLQRVRNTLTGCGLVDLGGSCRVLEVEGVKILLGGNEAPWQKPPLAVSELPVRPDDPDVVSILLSHSPDQFSWAQRAGYKLMLAGHTHGGQGRLPIIGPLLSPCLTGVKYSAGIFYEPPTLLHVSRGISGMTQVRINCPPELTKLVLRPA